MSKKQIPITRLRRRDHIHHAAAIFLKGDLVGYRGEPDPRHGTRCPNVLEQRLHSGKTEKALKLSIGGTAQRLKIVLEITQIVAQTQAGPRPNQPFNASFINIVGLMKVRGQQRYLLLGSILPIVDLFANGSIEVRLERTKFRPVPATVRLELEHL